MSTNVSIREFYPLGDLSDTVRLRRLVCQSAHPPPRPPIRPPSARPSVLTASPPMFAHPPICLVSASICSSAQCARLRLLVRLSAPVYLFACPPVRFSAFVRSFAHLFVRPPHRLPSTCKPLPASIRLISSMVFCL